MTRETWTCIISYLSTSHHTKPLLRPYDFGYHMILWRGLFWACLAKTGPFRFVTISPVEAVVSELWDGRYAAICMGQRNGIIASESGLMPLPGPDRSPPLVTGMEGGKETWRELAWQGRRGEWSALSSRAGSRYHEMQRLTLITVKLESDSQSISRQAFFFHRQGWEKRVWNDKWLLGIRRPLKHNEVPVVAFRGGDHRRGRGQHEWCFVHSALSLCSRGWVGERHECIFDSASAKGQEFRPCLVLRD